MSLGPAAVERRQFAPDFSLSRIITGLWQIADMERDGTTVDAAAAAAAMQNYVEAGLTTFDMADHYGSAEVIAGVHKAGGGSGAEYLTKWVPPAGAVSPREVRTAVERALTRMQTSRIDLLQFHAWNYADPSWLDCLFELDALKQEGLIRHLGLTNFDTAHLRIVLKSGIAVLSNQVCFSLLDRRAAHGMTALCSENGVGLLAFGTLAGGFLSERWLNQPEPSEAELKTWSQMKYFRFIRTAGGWSIFQKLLLALAEIAEKHGVPIPIIALRTVLDEPGVGAVIVGARLGESEHIQDNLRVFSTNLDADDRASIASCIGDFLPIPGDCGDEYRKPPYLTASGDLSHHLEKLPVAWQPVRTNEYRTHVVSGTPWEEIAGFARAVRHGDHIWISGTTATHGDRAIGGNDLEAQTHFIIDKIEASLQSLGATIEDVVRTRIFIQNVDDWEPVSRAHGQRFKTAKPANTLVQAEVIGEPYLVEMEAEAIVAGSDS